MEILLRYDEVITEKASKFQISELREDLYRNFTKIVYSEDLSEKLTSQKNYIEMMHKENMEKFEEINKFVSVEIYTAVKKAVK
jgi:hypothetical protein